MPTSRGAIIGYIFIAWEILRGAISFFADFADLESGFGRFVSLLTLPNLGWLNSTVLHLLIVIVGLVLVWNGRRPDRFTVQREEEHKGLLRIIDTDLPHGLRVGLDCLAYCQGKLDSDLRSERFILAWVRRYFDAAVDHYRLASKDSGFVEYQWMASSFLENRGYPLYVEMCYWSDRYLGIVGAPDDQKQVKEIAEHFEQRREIQHALDVQWGYKKRENVELLTLALIDSQKRDLGVQ